MASSSSTTAVPVWRSHYGGASGYTPEPNGVLEATMSAAELGGKRRALAWVIRYSTGNHSEFVAVNGRPVGVVHCAASIGVDKGQTSRILNELEDEQEIAFEGRTIYRIFRGCECQRCSCLREKALVHSQERAKLANVRNNPSPFILLRDKRFRSFLESSWREAHPNEAAELAAAEQAKLEAEQIIERKLQLALDEFRKLQPADEQPAQTVSSPPPADPTTDRIAEVRAVVDPIARKLRDTPSEKLIAAIERNLQGAPVEWLAQRITERKQALRKLGLVANLAEDVGRAWGSESLIRAAEEARRKQQEAAQNEEYVAALADAIEEGNETLLEAASVDDLNAARELLNQRNAPAYRRPTESETRVNGNGNSGNGSGALPGRNGSDRRGALSAR